MSTIEATIELFYGGAWQDITSYVYNRAPIQIRRGLSAEGSRADPGSLTLTINNRDGRFSPRNPRSPLYGLIGRNTPIRVSAGLAGSSQTVRFVGEVVAWPTRWDTAGTDVWVPVTAAGILRRLGTPSRPLRPAIYRWALAQNPAPVAYWPLDERWDASSARSATGGSAIARSTGAAPLWGEGNLGEWMPPALRLEQQDDTGSAVVGRFSTGSTTWAVEAMLRPEEGSPMLQAVGTIGGNRVTWQAFINPLFSRLELTLTIVDEEGSGSGGPLGVFPVAGLGDGKPHLVRWEISPDGSHTAWRVLVDGVEAASGSTSSTAWSVPPHPGNEVRIGVSAVADRQVADVGHVLVWADTIPDAAEAAEAALGYVGEAAGRRVERLCAEEGITLATVGDLDLTMPMGPQRPATLLELLDECAAVEAAGVVAPILVESRDALGLTFRTREQLYTTGGEISGGLVLDYAAGHVAPPLEPTPDDQRLANDVVASRPSGSEARVSDETGPLGAETIGRYQVSRSLPVQSDLQLPDVASWGLHHGTWDEDRYPTIRVDVRALNTHGGDVASALALDSGGTLCIDNPPEWLPPGRIEQLVLGYSESIQIGAWSQDWVTSPAGPYRVSVWSDDESTPGPAEPARYDTARCAVVVLPGEGDFHAGSDTTLHVLTTLGPEWTTDPADLPFDIHVAGVRLRVTAVAAGLFGTQTMTVEQEPVNGVVKTIPAGSAVSLWTPARYAL